jgi:hypothetical protein
MKTDKIAIITFATLMSINSIAAENAIDKNEPIKENEERIVLMYEKTVPMEVKIDNTNVKLSRADYSVPVVKVLIPALADATLLNHRNSTEGAPCMATYQTHLPSAVIGHGPGKDTINVNIKVSKSLYVARSPEKNNELVCYVQLNEDIETNIRGFKFVHHQVGSLNTRHIDDCR